MQSKVKWQLQDTHFKTTGTAGKMKKSQVLAPGMVALQEIRRYQKSYKLLICKQSFMRLVQEITQDFMTDILFQSMASITLQEVAQVYLVGLFDDRNLCPIHARWAKDTELARHICGKHKWSSVRGEEMTHPWPPRNVQLCQKIGQGFSSNHEQLNCQWKSCITLFSS